MKRRTRGIVLAAVVLAGVVAPVSTDAALRRVPTRIPYENIESNAVRVGSNYPVTFVDFLIEAKKPCRNNRKAELVYTDVPEYTVYPFGTGKSVETGFMRIEAALFDVYADLSTFQLRVAKVKRGNTICKGLKLDLEFIDTFDYRLAREASNPIP